MIEQGGDEWLGDVEYFLWNTDAHTHDLILWTTFDAGNLMGIIHNQMDFTIPNNVPNAFSVGEYDQTLKLWSLLPGRVEIQMEIPVFFDDKEVEYKRLTISDWWKSLFC